MACIFYEMPYVFAVLQKASANSRKRCFLLVVIVGRRLFGKRARVVAQNFFSQPAVVEVCIFP